jgi:hypothetical protein
MPDLQLSPSAQLNWIESAAPDHGAPDVEIVRAFEADWREGLFLLAARRR